MTPKEYLKQAYRIDQQITSKLDQLDSIKALATKTTGTLSDMPRSSTPNPQRLEDIMVKIMDMEHELDEEIDQLVDLKRKIKTIIDQVENVEYRLLLEKRYLCFMTWEKIAFDLGYTTRNVLILHDKALVQLAIP